MCCGINSSLEIIFSWKDKIFDMIRFQTDSYIKHLPQVLHISVSGSGQHWFRKWLFTYSVPSHYLNQCWLVVNWTLRNKLRWNLNQNTKLFVPQNESENIVEMASILSTWRWLNWSNHAWYNLPIIRSRVKWCWLVRLQILENKISKCPITVLIKYDGLTNGTSWSCQNFTSLRLWCP